MAKQLKRHVATYVASMLRHIHIHKNLHSPMLRMWQKNDPAHVNRLRITTQPQNSVCISSRYVQHQKYPHPEKAKKLSAKASTNLTKPKQTQTSHILASARIIKP